MSSTQIPELTKEQPVPIVCPASGEKIALDRKLQVADMLIKAVSTIAVVVGGLVGVFSYLSEQRRHQNEMSAALEKDRQDRQERQRHEADQRKQEIKLRQKELQIKFYEQQMLQYLSICDVAARLATAARLQDAVVDLRQFNELYWGKVCVFESTAVEAAQRTFYDALAEVKDLSAPPPKQLRELAYRLAHACREDLKTGFNDPQIGNLPTERNAPTLSPSWMGLIGKLPPGKLRPPTFFDWTPGTPFTVVPHPSLSSPLLPNTLTPNPSISSPPTSSPPAKPSKLKIDESPKLKSSS